MLNPSEQSRKLCSQPTAEPAEPDKLYRARSRLYRSEILQENVRLKALAEIYTMHSFAQLCNLNFLSKFCQRFGKFLRNNSANFANLAKFLKIFAIFRKILAFFRKNVIQELCKGMHCVDLGESFQTHIYLQNLASIQPRTSPVKFYRRRVEVPAASYLRRRAAARPIAKGLPNVSARRAGG